MKKILCFLVVILLASSFYVSFADETSDTTIPQNAEMPQGIPGDMGDGRGGRGGMGGGMRNGTPPQMPSGEMTPPEMKSAEAAIPDSTEQVSDDNTTGERDNMFHGGGTGGRMPFENMPESISQQETAPTSTISELFDDHFTLISTVLALVFGFIFVIFYNNK